MNTNDILKADVLDIIFDNRNKLYGAYPLRKYYPERVKISLVVMFAIASLFSIYSLVPSSKTIVCDFPIVDESTLTDIMPPEKKEIKPANKQSSQKRNTQKFTDNIVPVPDNKVTDTLHNISKLDIGAKTNIEETDGPPGDGLETGNGGGGDGPVTPEATETPFNPKDVLDNADVPPMYPGGVNALRIFLERNLTNPEEIADGEEIRVKVKFIVGYDGELKGFEIIQDGGAAFNNEVLRVLKKMPDWIPGKSNGRNVSVYHVIPVKFVQ